MPIHELPASLEIILNCEAQPASLLTGFSIRKVSSKPCLCRITDRVRTEGVGSLHMLYNIIPQLVEREADELSDT